MGKPAGRLGDIGSEHNGFPPTPITSGSPDVTINGKPAARVGDSLAPHSKPKNGTHGRSIAAGSSSVTINGRPAARMGSAISCGGTVIMGSGDVTIGDAIVLTKPSDVALPDIVFPNQRGAIPEVAPAKVYANYAMWEREEVKINDQDRHAECNMASAQSGAAFVKGTVMQNKTEEDAGGKNLTPKELMQDMEITYTSKQTKTAEQVTQEYLAEQKKP